MDEQCGGLTVADLISQGEMIFHDTHDGDYKLVQVKHSPKGDYCVITPFANDQKWSFIVDLDTNFKGTINFSSDSGKPNPPPVALQLQFEQSHNGQISIVFFDDSNTISQVKNQQANIWYNLKADDFKHIKSYKKVCDLITFE